MIVICIHNTYQSCYYDIVKGKVFQHSLSFGAFIMKRQREKHFYLQYFSELVQQNNKRRAISIQCIYQSFCILNI